MTDRQILAAIKKSEGWPTYTNHAADLGGPTKGGITLVTLKTWRRDTQTSIADLQALTESEADQIYQSLYLQPFASVTDTTLRHFLIDIGVLRGPVRAVMMLQEMVGVTADGLIGPQTLLAMAPFAKHLLVLLIGARLAHIETRVHEDPSQSVFRKGWRVRTVAFLPS